MIMWVDSIMAELEEIIESCGCTLYDVSVLRENEAQILRISIIKDGGVSLDDCELVSQSISPFLDVKDVIKDAYTLEVSSPGIERVLKNPRHFMLSCGEMVQIRLLDKQEIVGVLVKVSDSGVWLDVAKMDSRDLDGVSALDSNGFIPYTAIKRAKTIFEW